ncbi:hydroxysteroid 11-beta-dehydrogenase 1-like protein isoform 1-T1 [Ciconia maguari]
MAAGPAPGRSRGGARRAHRPQSCKDFCPRSSRYPGLASSIRGRRLQYFRWSAQLQDFTLFFTTWKDMKPVGKVLCATGIVAGLLAFFWKDPFNPESLSGARVLLTGASAGIGEQMAYRYARFGAEIVLTARREAVLQKVVEKCLTLGAKKIFYIPADMSSPSEPEKVVQFAVQKLASFQRTAVKEEQLSFQFYPRGAGKAVPRWTYFMYLHGGLDYLVLNHIGMTRFQMWAGDVEYTRWLMQVNFFSYVALATAALPTLEQNKGSLVVVSSLTGKIPTPFTTSYSATKFALDGFFSSLRHELNMQKRNVSVTLCILGLIDTDTALENTRCVFAGGCRSLGGSVSAGTCFILKACKKCTTVCKMVCVSVWMCKKINGKSASAWVHHRGCACPPQHET